MHTYSPDMIKPLATFTKYASENSNNPNNNNYPHQNRVFYKKYINEVNQALQSLITAGRLKRMELMSINNRALFNRGKVQRCQWTIKRPWNGAAGGNGGRGGPGGEMFLPDLENISLDNRSPKRKGSGRRQTQGKALETSREETIIDMLIQKQIARIKQENLLNLGHSQQQIVKQACEAIQKQILQSNPNPNPCQPQCHPPHPPQKQTIPTTSLKNSKIHHNRYILARKDHRRSVTQSAYSQQLEQVERKNNAFLKCKQLDKKSFLRRIKQLPIKN